MKIKELIELLQEEETIHPHSEVMMDFPKQDSELDIAGIDFDGQVLHLHPAP